MSQDPSNLELDGIGRAKLRHMQKHQPNLCRHLKSQNKLMPFLLNVQEQAALYIEKATAADRPFEETWDVIRETWISLPDVDGPQDETPVPAASLTIG